MDIFQKGKYKILGFGILGLSGHGWAHEHVLNKSPRRQKLSFHIWPMVKIQKGFIQRQINTQ